MSSLVDEEPSSPRSGHTRVRVRPAVHQCGAGAGGDGGGAGCSGWNAEPSDGRSVKPGIVGFITDTDSENAPSPAFRFTCNIKVGLHELRWTLRKSFQALRSSPLYKSRHCFFLLSYIYLFTTVRRFTC